MKFGFARCIATAAVVSLGAGSAHAALIPSGNSFDLIGSVRVTTATTFEQATALDFGQGTGPITYGTPGGTVMLGGFVNTTYTALGFNLGNTGSVADLPSLAVGPQAISGFYSFTNGINTLAFNLSTISTVTRLPASGSAAAVLSISGTGTLNLTGYDPTPGTFTLTTSNTGTGTTATFQSSVTSVPEPAFLSAAAFGVAALVRRRRA